MTIHNGISTKLLELASRPEGCSASDLCPTWDTRQIGNNAGWLMREGRLIAVGVRALRRYFTSQADADRYAEQLLAIQQQRKQAAADHQRQENAKRMARRRQSQPKPHQAPRYPLKAEPAPMRFAEPKVKWADQIPQITSDTKVTIAKSPAQFGPAARLLNVKREQIENNLPPLKVGSWA
jgi:hypothetical protein